MKCDEIVRLFMAVELNDEVRRNLGRAISGIRQTGIKAKCVSLCNLHVTMVFIGDVAGAAAEQVCEVMDGSVRGCGPFSCEVRGIGFFGSPRSPRVVWAGLAGNVAPLADIHGRLMSGLSALDLNLDEREFHPHITLARIRSSRNAPVLVGMAETYAERSFGTIDVESVTLMRSLLQPQGPIYSVIHRSLL